MLSMKMLTSYWFLTSRMRPPRIRWLSAGAHVARVVLFHRSSRSMHFLVDAGRGIVDCAWFLQAGFDHTDGVLSAG